MVRSWWCLKDVRIRFVLWLDPGIPGAPGDRPNDMSK